VAATDVHDEVHLEGGGNGGVDLFEEPDEGLGVVAGGVGGEHLTGVHIERGHQAGGAMTHVFELLAYRPARCRRSGGVRAAAGLDGGLLIDRQHQRVEGRDRYRPHTSTTRSQNSGSSLRVNQKRILWGLMSKSARIRPI
jgi:hypothetical protein